MSDLEKRIANHLWQLAPHVRSRTTARLLDEALEEIKALSQPWRPIHTAPTDGSEFLAWCPTTQGGQIDFCYWDKNLNRWQEPDAEILGEMHPTLWMPIPMPPSSVAFLSGEENPLNIDASERRFMVVMDNKKSIVYQIFEDLATAGNLFKKLRKTEGYWWLYSHKDPRWDREGKAELCGGMEMPKECQRAIEELKKTLGDPPDDLAFRYMKE